MDTTTRPTLSVVVPAFREAEALPLLFTRLRPVLEALQNAGDLPDGYEVVVVDDGSPDNTRAIATDASAHWPELQVLALRRNVGHQLALTAGLDHCTGQWAVSLDADLQDPPELIGVMLSAALSENVDVVYAQRSDRSTDTVFKRATADVYYRLMRRATGVPLEPHVGDYRLLSREVLEALRALPERSRVLRLLLPYLGFPSTTVAYKRETRSAGETKYPMRKMVRLAWDSATAFGTGPLRLATIAGGFAGLAGALGAILVMTAAMRGMTVPGWASIGVVMCLGFSLNFFLIGVLGEYIGRIYSQVQNRPLYDLDVQRSAQIRTLQSGRGRLDYVLQDETVPAQRINRSA